MRSFMIQPLLTAALLAASGLCAAQAWPSKPITFVVPSPPGGLADTLTRAVADEMSKRLGQPIVIDNRGGAGGMIGAQVVARAQPDGYTVLFSTSSPIMNGPLVTKASYEVKRDFAFVTQLCTGPLLFTVNTDLVPARTMQEFLAWAARNKGRLSYGSYGIGTMGHLVGAFMNQSRGLDMAHVAYKGEAPMVQDLVAGQVPWAITSAGTSGPHLRTGKLLALAVIGGRRSQQLPEVPTMAEAGLPEPEYLLTGWMGVLAPAGTPAAVLAVLEREARAAAQTTAVKARFQVYGMEAVASTPAEFAREYDTTAPVYERMVRAAGAKAE
ncbi:tripartite tricarboxylate transporter substrate binding protein [Pseudorhodoferax sp.]|uniref:tripartite tricarboxylate transporter substrate binding protein n=1 Tax=Pseudorhodoferax sp. TaxID=1993553 RepID=UPI002DD69847|nr:tripartite tricarboxylate transporter substrate binding protein [Pseudorhodoferax sp.]